MKASSYATALANLSASSEPEALVKNLVRNLKAKGRLKMLPAILRELSERQQRTKAFAPSLEVAKAEDVERAKAEAKAAGIRVETVTVNKSLLSGWRARSGALLIDKSGKQGLVALYQNITN